MLKVFFYALWVTSLLMILALVVSCSAQTSPTTTIPQTTSQQILTWGTRAEAGAQRYSENCLSCHELNRLKEEVPELGDAQGLLDFISSAMPLNAPGSLSDQSYSNILAYILVETGFVEPNNTFDESNLASIPLGE